MIVKLFYDQLEEELKENLFTVKALLSPQGACLILDTPEGAY